MPPQARHPLPERALQPPTGRRLGPAGQGWVHSGPDSEAGAAAQIPSGPGRGQTGPGLMAVGRERTAQPSANTGFGSIYLFWQHHVACRTLVPHLGAELVPLAVTAVRPNHWTAGKFLRTCVLKGEGPAQPSGLCGGLPLGPPDLVAHQGTAIAPRVLVRASPQPGRGPAEGGARLGPAPLTDGDHRGPGAEWFSPRPVAGVEGSPMGADLFSPPPPPPPHPHLPGSSEHVALCGPELSPHRPRVPGAGWRMWMG